MEATGKMQETVTIHEMLSRLDELTVVIGEKVGKLRSVNDRIYGPSPELKEDSPRGSSPESSSALDYMEKIVKRLSIANDAFSSELSKLSSFI